MSAAFTGEFGDHTVNEIADLFWVGDHTVTYITRMREPVPRGQEPSQDLLVGDVLRRTCTKLGQGACLQVCQAPADYENLERDCSDRNLKSALDVLLRDGETALMVGVTADRVGFYDQLDKYREEGLINVNSQDITEIKGFNAFFAYAEDDVALGRRLADCGDINIEMMDSENRRVIGFMHLSRTNLQGDSALKYDYGGEKLGAFEFFLYEALEHYGGRIADVRVSIAAAISEEHFAYTFADKTDEAGNTVKTAEQVMEELFPGWYKASFLDNITNPKWKPGDPIDPADKWLGDFQGMVIHHIQRSGVSSENVEISQMIDPGDLELGHASNHYSKDGTVKEARDLYITIP